MVLHVRTQETGLTAAGTEACMRCLFMAPGGPFVFFGCDPVRIVE